MPASSVPVPASSNSPRAGFDKVEGKNRRLTGICPLVTCEEPLSEIGEAGKVPPCGFSFVCFVKRPHPLNSQNQPPTPHRKEVQGSSTFGPMCHETRPMSNSRI